mmetsp:Transcript_67818/g.113627  ORF Transcript_67818/g.113627 Transcript_67818/m.113627 type:complete len:380 (-) Transcript_67818:68-1207(-)
MKDYGAQWWSCEPCALAQATLRCKKKKGPVPGRGCRRAKANPPRKKDMAWNGASLRVVVLDHFATPRLETGGTTANSHERTQVEGPADSPSGRLQHESGLWGMTLHGIQHRKRGPVPRIEAPDGRCSPDPVSLGHTTEERHHPPASLIRPSSATLRLGAQGPETRRLRLQQGLVERPTSTSQGPHTCWTGPICATGPVDRHPSQCILPFRRTWPSKKRPWGDPSRTRDRRRPATATPPPPGSRSATPDPHSVARTSEGPERERPPAGPARPCTAQRHPALGRQIAGCRLPCRSRSPYGTFPGVTKVGGGAEPSGPHIRAGPYEAGTPPPTSPLVHSARCSGRYWSSYRSAYMGGCAWGPDPGCGAPAPTPSHSGGPYPS